MFKYVVLSCAFLSFAACQADEIDDVILETGASEVTISENLKECVEDADCQLVLTGCDYCCQQQAINKAEVDSYQTAFHDACEGYDSGVCGCILPTNTAQCDNGLCTESKTP